MGEFAPSVDAVVTRASGLLRGAGSEAGDVFCCTDIWTWTCTDIVFKVCCGHVFVLVLLDPFGVIDQPLTFNL